jgi:ABC-type nitrate/sulfonate/bicarbonate transport system permease component
MNFYLWIKRAAPALLFAGLLLILWQQAVQFYAIPDWILPTPLAIGRELLDSFARLQADLQATLRIALLGLAWGVGIGVLLAVLLHLFPWGKRVVYPFLLLSQNIPLIALAPLLIVWFGFGDLPKLLVVMLVCFFPVTVATLDGFTQTDRTLKMYLQMSGASRWFTFRKLEWPSALPSFFSGLKLAATYSVMGAVIAEWLGAEAGIGKVMTISAKAYQTERLFVAILLVVALSLLLFALVTLLENRIIRWRQSEEKGAGK